MFIVASTVFMSVLSVSANAQTAVLNFTGAISALDVYGSEVTSTFTFNKSMILNSIGFLYVGDTTDQTATFAYKIGDTDWKTFSYAQLNPTPENGILYYNYDTPLAVASGSTVTISTPNTGLNWRYRNNYTVNNLDVSHTSSVSNYAAGNIKVTNPGSNVAPEPATFALALTGGAALIGICIRRRRNAA
jgi:hypothetical protein